MKLAFTERAWDEYVYWQAHDRTVLKRVNRLIEDVLRSPTAGIGKPEPLRHMASDVWSRRITEEHRLVYIVADDEITIVKARFHY